MNSCLYLTRNGLLEPLGQSQVLPYLKELSKQYRISLITYEKDDDFNNHKRMNYAREECIRFGINWQPQRYSKKKNKIGALFSIFHMIILVFNQKQLSKIRLIHARSYIPAAAALIINRIKGIPFIFDMRALWAEELITAGRIKRNSFIHKFIICIESECIKNAFAIVALTNASVAYLKKKYSLELRDKKIYVIPTCADLNRFSLKPLKKEGDEIHGCLGTVLSGWFKIDWLGSWFSQVNIENKNVKFQIITQDNAENVRQIVDPNNVLNDKLYIQSKLPEDVPKALKSHTISIMFYAGGEISELGRCPTRMAEALGCGIPIVANDGVGDVADIIRNKNVGVILKNHSKEEIKVAIKELRILMNDPQLPYRCRSVAEELFSHEAGSTAYLKIYNSIIDSTCAE